MHLSKRTLIHLGFIEQLSNGEYAPAANVRKQQLHLMWELRHSPTNAYLVAKALPFLYDHFVHEKRENVEEATQLELLYMVLHLVDRKPCRTQPTRSGCRAYSGESLQAHAYRQECDAAMKRLETLIAESEAALDGIEDSER